MTPLRKVGGNPASKHHVQPECGDMNRLTRDGTAEHVSRDQILRRERGQGKKQYFSCLTATTCRMGNHPVDAQSATTRSIRDDPTIV